MMNSRYMRASLLAAMTILPLLAAAPAAAAERYVVLPFANETGEESLYWMGEAMAIGLTDHLLAAGLDVVESERRRAALLEMGLDSLEPVTLASAILLGRRLGADTIVIGHYALQDNHGMLIAGRAVADGETGQEAAAEVRGSLSELHGLQRRFIADLVTGKTARSSAGTKRLMRAVEQIPLSSLEMYSRAMSAADPEERRALLTSALESDPLYPAALMERAQLEIEEGRPESAFLWLDRIQKDEMAFPERYWRARGDAAAAAGDRGSAVDHYQESLALRPLAATHFNLAAVLAQQGKLMDARRQVDAGLALDPSDPHGIELREALAHDKEHAA